MLGHQVRFWWKGKPPVMDGINLNKFDPSRDDRIDKFRVQRLKSALESNPRTFLSYWIPGGKFVGTEYILGDLQGGAGKAPGKGSARISIAPGRIGVGADFNAGQKVGDLIDVYRAVTGQDFVESVKCLEEWVGNSPEPSFPDLLPTIPADQIAPPAAHVVETVKYDYLDYDSNFILSIDRVVKSDGSKEYYPTQIDGSRTLPDNNRPLYNLPGICDSSFIVFVEGEKCANHLIKRGYVATTCIGGSNAPIEKTDLSPLEGKHVGLWADNDQGGIKFMESLVTRLINLGIPRISAVRIPTKKPTKWDAADATDDELHQLIKNIKEIHHEININDEEFSARDYDDNPKPEKRLLEGGFSLGSCSMVAAEGGTGKSMMFLDLCLKVAYGAPFVNESFGSTVAEVGNSIFITAEDTRNDIHTRIAMLDWKGERHTKLKYDLKVIPLLSLGSTFPLLYVKDGELLEHPSWAKMRDQILDIKNLKLIAFDPMSMLVHANITSDPSIASLVCAQFNRLGVETGASVLISHHFSKGDYDANIETPEQARKYVRGTTGLVDSVRNTYCLWRAPPAVARSTCVKLGIDFKPDLIYFGATVKSNYKTIGYRRIFKRDELSGLLECVNKNYDATKDPTSVEYVYLAVKEWIKKAASEGTPLHVGGGTDSISNQIKYIRDEYARAYFMNRDETIEQVVNRMINNTGELVLHHGIKHGLGKGNKWLDVPGGALDAALGISQPEIDDDDDDD